MHRILTALSLAVVLAGCGNGLPLPTGSTATERGEANAINPARNITVVCEDTTKNQNAGVTTTITNNCNKHNPVTTTTAPAE